MRIGSKRRFLALVSVSVVGLSASCSSDEGAPPPALAGSGGRAGAAGASGADASVGSSGAAGAMGSGAGASGGSGGSGGSSGGTAGSSGSSASGGAGGTSGSGGTTGSGGTSGRGGSAGSGGTSGASGRGGSAGSGATGGNSGSAGSNGTSGTGGTGDSGTSCFRATRLWFEDWETGDYSRWTSQTYGNSWGNACQSNALSQDRAVSPTRSHRSEITCTYTTEGNVHRGYGGLQFSGDQLVPAYTNTGQGIDAPFGIVNTFHVWFDTTATFTGGKWFSFWTVNGSCDWSENVLTLGLEDPSHRLAAAHYQTGGGTRTFAPGAPGVPLRQWVRITVYVNYHTETMYVWQNGTKISDVTFVRASTRICQWHWGAYASGDNDNVVLHEDDNSIWKLQQAWNDFSREPWFGQSTPVCP
jgi:hypothetical protein